MNIHIDFDKARYDPIEDDIFAFTHLDKKVLKVDLDLFSGKWFDYRHLTPLEATKLYIQAFEEVGRRHYKTNFDRLAAQYIKFVSFERIENDLKLERDTIKAKTKLTSYWRGRQMADALGMPYEIYIDLAIEYRLRSWDRSYLPQPGHLYSDSVVDRIEVRWAELKTSRLYYAEHPMYLLHNFDNLAHQNDYHEFLFEQTDSRTNRPEVLASMINQDKLPYEKVASRVTPYEFEQVQRYLH